MKRIGLTGGIASGKSTVAVKLRALGATVIDADLLAREIVKPQEPALLEIEKTFGSEMISPDGTLDRKRLGALVFQDPEKLALLNAITHPRIIALAEKRFQEAEAAGAKATFLDAALLFEAGWDKHLDAVWVVAVPPEEQLRRLVARDGFTPEEAEARIRAQLPLEEKVRRAQVVIDNSGALADTYRQVKAAYLALLGESS